METKFNIDKIRHLTEKMVGFGPRLTGSPAHAEYIALLKNELMGMGYIVKSDILMMKKRWAPKKWSLKITGKEEEFEVPDVCYFPYSGVTPPEGISGKLAYCGKNLGSFIIAKDKIAIIEMSIFDASIGLVFKKRSAYPPEYNPPRKMASPVVSSFVFPPSLKRAKLMGAKGVICVMSGCSDGNAAHQYLPFITYYQDCPALWVNETQGKKIIKAAKAGGSATLTLEACICDNCPSETFYAVLPGKNDKETILVNTHTDGTNAFEENGGIGMLALCEYFAGKPIEERERTLVFSFITGHFQLPQFGSPLLQATNRFLSAHKELWDGKRGHKKAVAGLSIEHFGCTEWHDSKDKKEYIKTSEIDPELVFTANKKLSEVYLEAIKDRDHVKVLTLKPKNFVYFGEGQPMYMAGIPTVSLVPGPDYLCTNAPDGYLDKVNYVLFMEQIETFKRIINKLDKMDKEEIGHCEPFAFGASF